MNLNMHPIEIRFEAIGKNVVPDMRLVRLDRYTTEILIGRVRRDDPDKREKPDNLLIDNKTVSRVHAWLILEEVDNHIYLKVRDENDAEKTKRLDGKPCRTHTYLNAVELNHSSRHKLDKTGTITFGFSGYEARDEYNNVYRTKASNWRYTWKFAARTLEASPAPSNENVIITHAATAKHTATNTFRAPSYMSSDENDSDYYNSPAPSLRVSASPIELSDDESEDEVETPVVQSSVPTVASTQVSVIDLTEGSTNSNDAAQREWSIRDWNNPAINTIPIHDSSSEELSDTSSDSDSEMPHSSSEEPITSGTKARLQVHVEDAARAPHNYDSEEHSEIDHSDCANCGGYDAMDDIDDCFEGFESDASMEARAEPEVDQHKIQSPYKTIEKMGKRVEQERSHPGSIPGLMIHDNFAARQTAAEAAMEKGPQYHGFNKKDGTSITQPVIKYIMKQQDSGATQPDDFFDRRFVATETLAEYHPSEFYPQLPTPVDRRSPTTDGGTRTYYPITSGVPEPGYKANTYAGRTTRNVDRPQPENCGMPLVDREVTGQGTATLSATGYCTRDIAHSLASSPCQPQGSLLMASSLYTPEVYDSYKAKRDDEGRTILTCPSGALKKNGGKALSIKELVGDTNKNTATAITPTQWLEEHKVANDTRDASPFTQTAACQPILKSHDISGIPDERQRVCMNFKEYTTAYEACDQAPLGLTRNKTPTGPWMEDLREGDGNMVRSLECSGKESPERAKRKADDISELVAEETKDWNIFTLGTAQGLVASNSLGAAKVANNITATTTDPGVSSRLERLIARAEASIKAKAEATIAINAAFDVQAAKPAQFMFAEHPKISQGIVPGVAADRKFQRTIAAAKAEKEAAEAEENVKVVVPQKSHGMAHAVTANEQFQRMIIPAQKREKDEREEKCAEETEDERIMEGPETQNTSELTTIQLQELAATAANAERKKRAEQRALAGSREVRPSKRRRLTRVAELVGCAVLGAAGVFAALVATAPEDFS